MLDKQLPRKQIHQQEDQVVGKGWDGNDTYEKTLGDVATELNRNKQRPL